MIERRLFAAFIGGICKQRALKLYLYPIPDRVKMNIESEQQFIVLTGHELDLFVIVRGYRYAGRQRRTRRSIFHRNHDLVRRAFVEHDRFRGLKSIRR